MAIEDAARAGEQEGAAFPLQPPLDDGVVSDAGSDASSDATGGAKDERRTLWQRWRGEYQTLKPFVVVSSAYLIFTVTDGGVRTIVLFNAINAGFTAFQVSIMFVLYELAGVFTNLIAGVAGARWGIKATLLVGLVLQILGIGMLYGWQESFTTVEGIAFVTFAQMLSGIAKDLVKIPGKAVTKLVTPDEKQGRLFKMVSLITGWKNSLKGVGYFLGGALVQVNYFLALSVMMALTFLAAPWVVISLDKNLGQTRKENINLNSIFKKNRNINMLSAARLFLFGSRDAWFEVPLPFYLRSPGGLGWERTAASALLGGWIILYGQMQSWTPQLISKPLRQFPPNKYTAALWALLSGFNPLFLGCVVQFAPVYDTFEVEPGQLISLMLGLGAFALIFAVNSSVHSYLVVKYSEGDKVAMNVGFYYMSNAVGRLVGTLAGGALFSFVDDAVQETSEGFVTLRSNGLAACFWLSFCFVLVTVVLTLFIDDQDEGLSCGPCWTIVDPVDKVASVRGELAEGSAGPTGSIAESDEADDSVRASLEENERGARGRVAV